MLVGSHDVKSSDTKPALLGSALAFCGMVGPDKMGIKIACFAWCDSQGEEPGR